MPRVQVGPRLRALLVLVVAAVASAAFAPAASAAARHADRTYAVGKRSYTFVDRSRPTAANGSYAGAPTRTLPTLVLYPTAGAPGGPSVDGRPAAAPPRRLPARRLLARLRGQRPAVRAAAGPLRGPGLRRGRADVPAVERRRPRRAEARRLRQPARGRELRPRQGPAPGAHRPRPAPHHRPPRRRHRRPLARGHHDARPGAQHLLPRPARRGRRRVLRPPAPLPARHALRGPDPAAHARPRRRRRHGALRGQHADLRQGARAEGAAHAPRGAPHAVPPALAGPDRPLGHRLPRRLPQARPPRAEPPRAGRQRPRRRDAAAGPAPPPA